jgi:hypothetical protein
VTMIHEGLFRDVIVARPRQDTVFSRRIASIVKHVLSSKTKKKRHIVLSDEESPTSGDRVNDSSEDHPSSFESGSDTCAMCEGLAKVSICSLIDCQLYKYLI